MLKNIFVLNLLHFSCLYSAHQMDDNFEKTKYEEISQDEEKVVIEKDPVLVQKFVKNDFENFIFLTKVLNRKNVSRDIRNKILRFLYLPYPSKLNTIYSSIFHPRNSSMICSLLQFNEQFLIVGYASGHIMIWDMKKNKMHKYFKAERDAIVALLKMKNNIFVSFSKMERSRGGNHEYFLIIKVWNINSNRCLSTFEGGPYVGTMSYLNWMSIGSLFKLSDELLAVSTRFGDGCVFSIYSGLQTRHEDVGRTLPVEHMQEIERIEGSLEHPIRNFIYMGNNIVFLIHPSGLCQRIVVFNIDSKKYIKQHYTQGNSYVDCLIKINDFMFASQLSQDGNIRVWDIRKDDFLFEINKSYYSYGVLNRPDGDQVNRLIGINSDLLATSQKKGAGGVDKVAVYGPSFDVKPPEPQPLPECCCAIL